LAGLGGITVAGWLYIVVSARRMASGSAGMRGHSMASTMDAMTGMQPWTAIEFGLRLAMWVVMMVAMMVPTAAPMTLLYTAVARKAAAQHNPLAPTFVFVTGYIAMWTIFSLVATIAQHALDQAALLSPTMSSRSAGFGAALLIAAGVYQLTPFKNACLRNCRAPAHFLSREAGSRWAAARPYASARSMSARSMPLISRAAATARALTDAVAARYQETVTADF
jgi:predicted metal-binding membrane protein